MNRVILRGVILPGAVVLGSCTRTLASARVCNVLRGPDRSLSAMTQVRNDSQKVIVRVNVIIETHRSLIGLLYRRQLLAGTGVECDRGTVDLESSRLGDGRNLGERR